MKHRLSKCVAGPRELAVLRFFFWLQVLVALLMELAAVGLNATYLVVSATKEARGFWLRQGFHIASQCTPNVAAVMRNLAQHAERFGFFKTTLMARAIPEEASRAGFLVKEAVSRQKQRAEQWSKGVSPAKAAEELGYEDITCSFTRTIEGRADVSYTREEERSVDVPSAKLQAFRKQIESASSGSAAGWGVRCISPIKEGAVVVELCGQWLNDYQ